MWMSLGGEEGKGWLEGGGCRIPPSFVPPKKLRPKESISGLPLTLHSHSFALSPVFPPSAQFGLHERWILNISRNAIPIGVRVSSRIGPVISVAPGERTKFYCLVRPAFGSLSLEDPIAHLAC